MEGLLSTGPTPSSLLTYSFIMLVHGASKNGTICCFLNTTLCVVGNWSSTYLAPFHRITLEPLKQDLSQLSLSFNRATKYSLLQRASFSPYRTFQFFAEAVWCIFSKWTFQKPLAIFVTAPWDWPPAWVLRVSSPRKEVWDSVMFLLFYWYLSRTATLLSCWSSNLWLCSIERNK